MKRRAKAKGYREFEFDLPGALLEALVEAFDGMERAPLTPKSAAAVPEEPGVYQLFLRDEIVYVGKADAKDGLGGRLVRHAEKILHRRDLNPEEVSFKAIRVYVFTVMDLEKRLIRFYKGRKRFARLGWNGRGFGANDPGRERDTTKVKDTHFDAMHPVDIDRPLDLRVEGGRTAMEVLLRLKETLPYNLRFETDGESAGDLERVVAGGVRRGATARRVLEAVLSSLPPGWQATALPGYVILYRERRRYPAALETLRSP